MSTAIENNFTVPIVFGLKLQRTWPQALVAGGHIYTKTPTLCQHILIKITYLSRLQCVTEVCAVGAPETGVFSVEDSEIQLEMKSLAWRKLTAKSLKFLIFFSLFKI